MFSHIVSLYRESKRSVIEDGKFCYSGSVSETLRTVISACESVDDTYGRFEDSPEWTNDDYVEFCWLLADNEHGRFYSNVDELVARSRTLSRGERPQNFYVVEDDYLAGEPNEPERLQHAYELCDLIHLLSAISLVDDTSTATSPKKLIFVIPAGEKAPPRTLSLSTKLEPSTLAENRLNLLPLRRIASDENSHALHIHEHRSLFRLAVADAIGRAPSDVNTFTFLINCWPEVLEKYAFDIDCFVSNFSFEKVRLEIAQMELDFSGKISSVMGDSAAKFLGLPLPLAVLAVIYKTEGIIEAYLLFLGAILVVLLFSGMTHNQLLQLARIDHGFNIIFDQFKKKIKSYPASIAGRLEQAERGFAKQRSFLVRTLWLLRVLAWLPIAMGLALLAWKFHPGFQQWMVRQIPLWP